MKTIYGNYVNYLTFFAKNQGFGHADNINYNPVILIIKQNN